MSQSNRLRTLFSCFKQTSRRLLELFKIVFLSPNELTVVKKEESYLPYYESGGGAEPPRALTPPMLLVTVYLFSFHRMYISSLYAFTRFLAPEDVPYVFTFDNTGE